MRKMGADSLVDPVRMADALSSPGAAACFEAPGLDPGFDRGVAGRLSMREFG